MLNAVQNPWRITSPGLASFPFARHYLGNLGWFLFLALLRCFSSGGSPRIPMYSVYDVWIPSYGLLHSEICGSKLAYSSPQLIAVNHVLRRLPMPRHSPCAYIRFTICEFPLRDHWVKLHCIYPTWSKEYRLFLFFNVVWSNLLLLVVSSFALHLLFSFQGTIFVLFFSKQISEENFRFLLEFILNWWALVDSNHRPHAYQACALTCWAKSPWLVEMRGIEPLTPCLQSRCSPSWATPPRCTGFRLVPFWTCFRTFKTI